MTDRSNALWGSGSTGAGSGGKRARPFAAAAVVALSLVGALAASAPRSDAALPARAFVPKALFDKASASPGTAFRVIVQGEGAVGSNAVAGDVAAEVALDNGVTGLGVTRRFASFAGVSARLTGRQILRLADRADILAITENVPMVASAYSSTQQWPYAAGVARYWPAATNGSLRAPTIAIVDSGIEPGRTDFAGRVLADVKMTALTPNAPGDGRGHGTFVAGVAAGAARGYAGAAPNANLVSLDVMDDTGMAMTADVIAAADWILQNKDVYGIRVANFSLHSSAPASIFYDPLDRAVERLWFSGVVVVTAAGNYGVDGRPVTVAFAPANDPFVITVGAVDIGGNVSANNDLAAPWSTYGYTLDGFAKPELAAPGRYMVGPVPSTSTLALERPASVVAPGYIQLSGTSFAAPVVAGTAANLLALHPGWTPDQVKGALMLTAKATPGAIPLSTGVGEIDAARAADVTSPPNPNLALDRFVVPDPLGGVVPVFDAASWATAATADASWATASWATASWATASWATASWATASWATGSYETASWATASWASAAYEDGAKSDVLTTGAYTLDATAEAEAEADLGLLIDLDGTVWPSASTTTTSTVSALSQ